MPESDDTPESPPEQPPYKEETPQTTPGELVTDRDGKVIGIVVDNEGTVLRVGEYTRGLAMGMPHKPPYYIDYTTTNNTPSKP